MNFSQIANAAIEDLKDTYEYDGLGTLDYYQTITDVANYIFENCDTSLFVALEVVIEEELVKRGHTPNE